MIRRRTRRERARRKIIFRKYKKTAELFKRTDRVISINISRLFIFEVFISQEAILSFVGAGRSIRAGICNIKIYRVVCKVFASRWNIAVRDIRGFFRAGDSKL